LSSRQWLRRIDAFVVVAIAVPAIPVIVAVVRAILDKWIPLGDQALLEIRAHDVLTAHHPLLGTASSAALNRSEVIPLNHPGPLMFDVLAIPVRLFGAAGVAIGVELDAPAVARSNGLAAAVAAGFLDADPAIMTALNRFTVLRQAVEASTVAVLLVPAR
jgi:hypothetical protein